MFFPKNFRCSFVPPEFPIYLKFVKFLTHRPQTDPEPPSSILERIEQNRASEHTLFRVNKFAVSWIFSCGFRASLRAERETFVTVTRFSQLPLSLKLFGHNAHSQACNPRIQPTLQHVLHVPQIKPFFHASLILFHSAAASDSFSLSEKHFPGGPLLGFNTLLLKCESYSSSHLSVLNPLNPSPSPPPSHGPREIAFNISLSRFNLE